VKAIPSAGAYLNQAAAVGDESAQLSDVDRRHPDLRNQVGDEETGQRPDVVLVGLDPRCGDELDLVGVGHDGFAYQRRDDVVEGPGVGSGFDDDDIGRLEVFLCSLRETVNVYPLQWQDNLHLCVETAHGDVVLVRVRILPQKPVPVGNV